MAVKEPLGVSTAINAANDVGMDWAWMWQRLLAPLPAVPPPDEAAEQAERRPLDCESGERRSKASRRPTSDTTIARTAPAAPPSPDQATTAAPTADAERPETQARDGAA
jgi:hypothetical protein